MGHMPLIEREEAIEALPEMSEFRPATMEAWAEWRDLPTSYRSKLTPGARATSVHDLIIAAAARRLSGAARIYDKAGSKLFVFGDIAVRFKKHDEDLASRNQPTKQVKEMLGQRPLAGVPAAHFLEAGYILDRSETEIVATNLVCPNGRGNDPYWYIELQDEGYQFGVTDLFDRGPPPPDDDSDKGGSRWVTRESGVVIPFKRKSDDQS
jgi:hypothetical protein